MSEETTLQVQEAEKQEVEQSEAERTRTGLVFVPRTDIYETADAVHIVCDLPGVDLSQVDISVEKNVLKINGYVEREHPEGYTLAYAEYRVGDYQRQFALSNEIDQDRIQATLTDGVLRLALPKAQPTTRKIAIAGA